MFRISILISTLFFSTYAFAYPVTVNSCNREVTFEEKPTKVASNDVNLTEMMLVLGLQEHMVGYTGISGWNKLKCETWVKILNYGNDIN